MNFAFVCHKLTNVRESAMLYANVLQTTKGGLYMSYSPLLGSSFNRTKLRNLTKNKGKDTDQN